ncbi:MAG: MFS transporter [Undibacterium sp.]|uniref:MFS transporter n=1 Tax=Undibacterium sp. TaxID=1914977 RepID=UPI0027276A1E|nr:MFS transporter [Undibacterium sp.]MDO8651840.1 MFS transporter [Undibacterium sp.]
MTNAPLQGRMAIRVFLCFASGYLLSYALRAVNAVIAPALIAELQLSNADLGLLSSAYFFAFGSLQLPLGIWLDKYGPRRTEAALLLVAALGAAIFAMSHSLIGLWLGRALIGVGVSACLMASFKAYRLWFAPHRQSQLASWMLVAGTSGALLATVPVNTALPLVGWRGIFWITCGLLLLTSAALFFLLRPVEHARATPAVLPHPDAKDHGYRTIFADPYFRRMGMLGLVIQGIFVALQTLWAGSWMVLVLGMSKDQSAQTLFMLNLVLLLGYLALGWWAPRYVASPGKPGWPVPKVVTIGLTGMILTQFLMLFSQAQWTWLLWLLMALFYTVLTLVQTHLCLTFPVALAGRVSTAYNLLMFIGAFVTQWGIGVAIDFFHSIGWAEAAAIRGSFALCLGLQVLVYFMFVGSRAKARAFH